MTDAPPNFVLTCSLCGSPMEKDEWCGIPIFLCSGPTCDVWWHGTNGECSSCENISPVPTCTLGQCAKHCELYHRVGLPGHLNVKEYAQRRGETVNADTPVPVAPSPSRKPEPSKLVEVTTPYVPTAADRR